MTRLNQLTIFGAVVALAFVANVSHAVPLRCDRLPNLLQQLQIGSFLGIVAAGMMIVILIAQIDLSVPWTLASPP
jgi:ribose/xylose/arabinose/galactoside ABC-type transport system permease subunit